jgi:class 3 adenylate cyclase
MRQSLQIPGLPGGFGPPNGPGGLKVGPALMWSHLERLGVERPVRHVPTLPLPAFDCPAYRVAPMIGQETCPLPDDPTLAAVAAALNDAGHWAVLFDSRWRCAYATDDARLIYGGRVELAPYPIGAYYNGSDYVNTALKWGGGQFPLEIIRQGLIAFGPWMLADTPGGREELRELIDPRLRDIVDELSPADPPPAQSAVFRGIYSAAGAGVDILNTMVRLRDGTGQLMGTAVISKPAAGMAVLARITAMGDLRHFKRMEQVARPGRRPAAVLFADLEASSPLSRRLSTASYFALGRRIARFADQCVIDGGGLVGRHVGDGIVAFFLAETAGSESAAARACIQAAHALRQAMSEVAARSELAPEDLIMRFGLHWGATLYVGQIATSGRTEVTALGDEVNEGARIEACATGGRALASKALVERLDPEDAAVLGLDPDRITYTPLADLPTATEKARRDAPAITVCEV